MKILCVSETRVTIGNKEQLRYALAIPDSSDFPGGIQQIDNNFSGIVGIDQPDPLGNDNAGPGSEPAAGADYAGPAWLKRLYAQAGFDGMPFARLKDKFLSVQAGLKICPHGKRGRRSELSCVQGASPVTGKSDIDMYLDLYRGILYRGRMR